MNNPQTVAPEVPRLEDYRSPSQVYEMFYERYGEPGSTEIDGRRSQLIGARILHMDEDDDRSTHLIVRAREYAHNFPSRRQITNMGTNHIMPYDPADYFVAITNGTAIEPLWVTNMYGVHHGRIDTILNPYRPENETVYMQLRDSYGIQTRLMYNQATMDGTMALGQGNTGWILSAEESARLRMELLQPAAEPTADIGHIALAS